MQRSIVGFARKQLESKGTSVARKIDMKLGHLLVAAFFIWPQPVPGTAAVTVSVSSTAFSSNSLIPAEYTCDGADRNPDLAWSWIPDSAKSLAIAFDDPATEESHWVLWNLNPKSRSLPAGSSGDGVVGTNDFDHESYDGPCPPPGAFHYYVFTVYAVDVILPLKPKATRAELARALNGHVVGGGSLVGRYVR